MGIASLRADITIGVHCDGEARRREWNGWKKGRAITTR
jgi:hypothetical protein